MVEHRSSLSGGERRLLLVSADPSTESLLRTCIAPGDDAWQQCAVSLECALSVQAAAALLRRHTYDGVMVDLGSAPTATDVRRTHRVRQLAPDVAVLGLVASSEQAALLALQHDGAHDYVVRNRLTPWELRRFWQAALDRHAWQEQTLREQHGLSQGAPASPLGPAADGVQRMCESVRAGIERALAAAGPLGRAPAESTDQARPMGRLHSVATELSHLSELVDSFETKSVLETYRDGIDLSTVRWSAVTAAAHRHVSGLATSRNVMVRIGDCSTLPSLVTDVYLLQQLVTGLLRDAVQSSPPDGMVQVDVQPLARGRFLSHALTITSAATRADAEALQALVRQPSFNSASSSSSASGVQLGGRGDRLAALRLLTQAIGGELGVGSHPDVGTTLTVYLPRFAGGAVSLARLQHGVWRATQRQDPVSLLRVGLRSYNPDKHQHMLSTLRTRVATLLHRPSDIVALRPDAGDVLVLLPGTTPAGAAAVKDRLLSDLQTPAGRAGSIPEAGCLAAEVGLASLGQQASSLDTLIDRACFTPQSFTYAVPQTAEA